MALSTSFRPWTSSKCDFGELKNVAFLVFAWHCELIFCLLSSPKCGLDEVEKAIFMLANVTLKSFSVSRPTKNSKIFK